MGEETALRSRRCPFFTPGTFAQSRVPGPSQIDPARKRTQKDVAWGSLVVILSDVAIFVAMSDLS
eukprot:7217129-Pyramimonas_sp.AAC.1